jgi:hypothetical protein
MIVNERIDEYIELLSKENSEYIERIREEALATDVPIIKRSSEAFMKSLLKIKRYTNILELGTAVAYSTLIIAENSEAQITTVEKFEPRIKIAKENIKFSKFKDRIELICEDVDIVLKNLVIQNKKYDFIFMDAAKAQYIKWLPDIKLLLEDEGVLFSDNILQEGSIIESKFAIDRRDRTIHKRLREYLRALTSDKNLTTSIIPIGDGVALSIYNRRINE